MYRHIAESIKESSDKRFVSNTDIEKYESYPDKFIDRSLVYNKSEFDEIMGRLDSTFLHVEGENLGIVGTKPGFMENINILGKTVQDYNNLSDIKSVGRKISDDRYILTIKSVGKNICDGKIEYNNTYFHFETGKQLENLDYNTYIVRVHPDTDYTISFKTTIYEPDLCSNITYWDKDMNFISGKASNDNIHTAENCMYMRFTIHKSCTDIQVERGVEATDYEEYIEYMQNIELPCQLESVETFSDKLFKRNDGVWCIEKNIRTFSLHGASTENYGGGEREGWTQFSNEEYFAIYINLQTSFDNIPIFPEQCLYSYAICNNFRVLPILDNQSYYECVFPYNAQPNYIGFRIRKNRISDYDNKMINCTSVAFNEIMRNFFKENNTIIKIPMINPEIIELPQEMQIILNTYNEATNIFVVDTDIQPTISGRVVKSMGDEINNIRSQITEISDKIDLINKLSGNNTVQYSSDYGDVYIEESDNGIASDINIQGKSLVNCLRNGFNDYNNVKNAYYKLSGEILDEGYCKFEYNDTYDKQAFRYLEDTILKPSTQYTLVVDILECTISGTDNLHVLYPVSNPDNETYGNDCAFKDTWGLYANECIAGSRHVKLITTKDSFSDIKYGMRSYLRYIEGATGYISYRLLLLEGDYTENPPIYFEGIKSVGNASGVINIKSVNVSKNLFDINNFGVMGYSYEIPSTIDPQSFNSLYINVDVNKDSDISISMTRNPNWLSDIGFNIGIGGTYKVKHNRKYEISCNINCDKNKPCSINIIGLYEHELNTYLANDNNYKFYLGRVVKQTSTNGNENKVLYDSKDYDYIRVFIGGEYLSTASGSGSINRRVVTISNLSIRESKYEKDFNHEISTKKLIAKKSDGTYFEIDKLRSTGYISDSIEKHSDGKYYFHKRCAELLFNGTETWSIVTPAYQPANTDLISCNCIKHSGEKGLFNLSNLPLNDKFVSLTATTSMYRESIKYHTTDKLIRVAILKSRLNTLDGNGMTEWFTNNNMTVIYESVEEVYEIVNLDVNLFEGETNVYIDASPVKPKISLNANRYITDIVNNLKDRTVNLENSLFEQIKYQNKLLLLSTYSVDKTSLKVDVTTFSTDIDEPQNDYDIYKLLLNNIELVENISEISTIEEMIDFYTMVDKIDYSMADTLLELLYKKQEEMNN